MIRVLVVATGNAGKMAEIRLALAACGCDLVPWSEVSGGMDLHEDGETMYDNAVQKALAAARHTGTPALADDTGLVVDALDGRPGVRSARWAGAGAGPGERNRLLLTLMAPVPWPARQARFVCVAAVAWPDGRVVTGTGELRGMLLREPQGGHGFGYDPLFWLPGYGCTLAELEPAEKNIISHRGQALRACFARVQVGESEGHGG